MGKNDDHTLRWLQPGEPFPDVAEALGPDSGAPGLLAGGGRLDVASLRAAYAHGIFPWYSDGQPILWWSPDPRMVLQLVNFRLHASLRKTLRRFRLSARCEIRFDSAFSEVIHQCAISRRDGAPGSWIVPEMEHAYKLLHRAGYAHSVETWIDGSLAGGLYCVALGQAVFGESMFSLRSDASKIALSALVCFCRTHGVAQIDCQQNTGHLASLGATEMPRDDFLARCTEALSRAQLRWHFDPLYWCQLLPERDAYP